jgi:hypothetical protein
MHSNNHILNELDAAKYLGLSVSTLRRRRRTRKAPAWAKLGHRIVYRKADLDAFIEAGLVSFDTASDGASK